MSDELDILRLQAQLLELGSSVRQLQQAGLDSAAAKLLSRRKRAQLEDVMGKKRAQRTT
jgi:hypothetical protein